MTITFSPLGSSLTDGVADGALLLVGEGVGPVITMATGRCDGGFFLSGNALGVQFNGEVEPISPATGDGTLYLGIEAVGYERTVGQGEIDLALDGEGYGGGASTYNGYSDGGLRLTGYGAALLPLTCYGFLTARTPQMYGVGGLVWDRLDETISVSQSSGGHATAVLRAAIDMAGRPDTQANALTKVTDGMTFDTALTVVHLLLASEGFTLDAESTESRTAIARVVERLLMEGHASSLADAVSMVTSGMAFSAIADALALATATESIVTSAAVESIFTAMEALTESIVLAATSLDSHHATMLVEESVVIGSDLSSVATMLTRVQENVGLLLNLSIDNGEYVAWVLNTESRGLSQYTNYPFNSFAGPIGGKYYGATSTGIHRLGGDHDNGAMIQARIRMGMSDLGTRVLKRIPDAFIGYTSTGVLLLKVITSDEATGEKQAAHYRLQPRGAASVRENRFKIGRGIKSVDWAFEIENIDGADFELNSIEFRPLRLDRRTRG